MRFSPFNRRDPVPPGVVHPAGRARQALRPESAAPGDEVEAWLSGHLVHLWSSSAGRTMSPWLVVTRLAHADLLILQNLAGDEPEDTSPFTQHPTWAAAERGLARHVLDDTTAADVLRLQRDVLIPLELRLIEQSEREPLSLGQVVAATLKALRRPRLGPEV